MTFLSDLFLYLIFFFSLALCVVLRSLPCLPNNQMSAVSATGRKFPYWLVHIGNFPPGTWLIATSSYVSSAHEIMPLTHIYGVIMSQWVSSYFSWAISEMSLQRITDSVKIQHLVQKDVLECSCRPAGRWTTCPVLHLEWVHSNGPKLNIEYMLIQV